jgi:hypothetical protein
MIIHPFGLRQVAKRVPAMANASFNLDTFARNQVVSLFRYYNNGLDDLDSFK